jgi:hypothetical protein
LDDKAYQYRASSRKTYRPDKEFMESGIPEYVEWCLKKFINHYENIQPLLRYKEYREIRNGLKDTDNTYLSTFVIKRKGLFISEDVIKDIRLQVYLYYIVLLRNYKLIWRRSTQSYNKFSIYFRYAIFSKIGSWIRKKLDKVEYVDFSKVAYEEEIMENTEIFSPLGPKEISKLCLVSERQIKKILSDPYAKQKLVDRKYLKTRNRDNVSRIINETNVAQDWGIHIQRIWETNHQEGDKA